MTTPLHIPSTTHPASSTWQMRDAGSIYTDAWFGAPFDAAYWPLARLAAGAFARKPIKRWDGIAWAPVLIKRYTPAGWGAP